MSQSKRSWSGSDKYFVDGDLKLYSVDLSSGPLKVVPAADDVVYDGPSSGEFQSFLRDNDFRVNSRGEAIVRLPKLKTEDEFNFFLLAKENAMVEELHRKIMEWSNSEQLRLTMKAITDSIKKVFVDIGDLESPANGDTISVGKFLKKLSCLLREKEVGGTWLAVANVGPNSIGPKLKRGDGDWVGFLRRMNRTFVDEEGTYIKFDFRCVRGPDSGISELQFYGKGYHACDLFCGVQFDENESAPEIPLGEVSFNDDRIKYDRSADECSGARLVQQCLNVDCVFLIKEFYCFGRMTKVEDATFRSNDLVTNFFRQSPFGKRCFVDANATTFFVFTGHSTWFEIIGGSGEPRLIK